MTFTVQRLKLQGLLGILFSPPPEIAPELSIMIRALSLFLAGYILLCGEANLVLSLSPEGEFIRLLPPQDVCCLSVIFAILDNVCG